VEKFLRDFCSRCKRKLVLEEQKQYENQVAIEILCNKCEKISKGEEKKTELKI
jgi:PHP family Zn ribbon phosphoesterase